MDSALKLLITVGGSSSDLVFSFLSLPPFISLLIFPLLFSSSLLLAFLCLYLSLLPHSSFVSPSVSLPSPLLCVALYVRVCGALLQSVLN